MNEVKKGCILKRYFIGPDKAINEWIKMMNYVDIVTRVKILHEPVIILWPKSALPSVEPNWMNMEKMFQKLFWKLLQFIFERVMK